MTSSAPIDHEVDLRGAAHPGDLRAEGLGELHGVVADTSGRADYEHLLSCLDAPAVAEPLQRG